MNDQEYNEFIIRVPSGAETSLFKKLIDRMGWRIDRIMDRKEEHAASNSYPSIDDLWNKILN